MIADKMPRLATSEIEVRPVASAEDLDDFIRLPWQIYRDDPAWVPPLLFDQRRRLSPGKNPSLAPLDHCLFLAVRKGEVVGRISAQINPAYLARHDAETGHFGWLEAIDSADVFDALLAAAADWLRARGMRTMMGPFNFTINEECGLLIEGFGHPPYVMMTHARPYYRQRIEELGFAKSEDLYAYRFDLAEPVPAAITQLVQRVRENPAIRFRKLRFGNFESEVRIILDIYNSAWADNWGQVPLSDEEIRHAARDLRFLMRRDALCLAELNGEPVAFALGIANVNEAFSELDGRLLPLGWAKFASRLVLGRFRGARLPLLGVRKHLHHSPLGAALSVAVIQGLYESAKGHGIEEAELSWVLSGNRGANSIIRGFGAKAYKTYRIYEKPI